MSQRAGAGVVTTSSLSFNRILHGYAAVAAAPKASAYNGWRALSRRSKDPCSVSYRRRRRLFLQSYKLASVNAASRRSVQMAVPPKLKSVALKLKSAAASAAASLRIGALGCCRPPPLSTLAKPSPPAERKKRCL